MYNSIFETLTSLAYFSSLSAFNWESTCSMKSLHAKNKLIPCYPSQMFKIYWLIVNNSFVRSVEWIDWFFMKTCLQSVWLIWCRINFKSWFSSSLSKIVSLMHIVKVVISCQLIADINFVYFLTYQLICYHDFYQGFLLLF